MNISILDYEIGNISSIKYAFNRLKIKTLLTKSAKIINESDALILPGVGNANSVMKIIKENNIFDCIINFKKPVLGICLGMQIMCQKSEENESSCLDIFPLKVKKFDDSKIKVPQIGWNKIYNKKKDSLSSSTYEEDLVYYANSFYIPINPYTYAVSDYGTTFSAEIRKGNFWGLQYHPEKSGKVGNAVLKKFINLARQ